MSERWSLQIPLVLLPVDDFTGKVITGPDIEISVRGTGRPVVKPEGFRIFPKLESPQTQALLRGKHYLAQNVLIDTSALNPKHPVKNIRMLPSPDYPFPPDTAFIKGTVPEHSILLAAGGAATTAVKLRLDCKEGDTTLSVYQKRKKNLSGMTYLLTTPETDRDAKQTDWVRLLYPADFENGIYRLAEPLSHAYQKVNATLHPAVTYPADTMGTDYFIAVTTDTAEKQVPLRCRLTRDNKREEYEFFLKARETLRQDF